MSKRRTRRVKPAPRSQDEERKQAWDQFNTEIAEALPERCPPEAYIELGQMVGSGVSASEAIGLLMNPMTKDMPKMVEEGEYSGPLLSPAAMGELLAEHTYVTPTHRLTPQPPKLVGNFWWFPLESLGTHPLKDKFRSTSGRRMSFVPTKARENELSTFIRIVNLTCEQVPDWVDVLVFSSEPKDGPMWSTKDAPQPKRKIDPKQNPSARVKRIEVPDMAMQMVTFTIVACKQEPEGPPELPEWLQAHRAEDSDLVVL